MNNTTALPDQAARRAFSAQSMRETILLEGKRVHVVGAACDVAGLWGLLSEYPDSRGHYIYDPVQRYLVAWDTVAQVLATTRVFLPSQVEREKCVVSNEQHLFGIRTLQGNCYRFAPIVDEATFRRLTCYNGLPERWCAWHSGWTSAWRHALAHYPVITQTMWRRLRTGEEPEDDASLLVPQDPVPLLEQFVAYHQVTKTLRVVPATIKEANDYVRRFHRHCEPVIGAQYALAAVDAAGLVHGVALLGRPIARLLDVGAHGEMKRRIIEVRRVATDGTRNVNSMLYGAARRLAKEAGYEKIITYCLESEPGTGLLADGWKRVTVTDGKQWDHPGRPRRRKPIHDQRKYRWECELNRPRTFETIHFPMHASETGMLR